jgi:hypothetical protein
MPMLYDGGESSAVQDPRFDFDFRADNPNARFAQGGLPTEAAEARANSPVWNNWLPDFDPPEARRSQRGDDWVAGWRNEPTNWHESDGGFTTMEADDGTGGEPIVVVGRRDNDSLWDSGGGTGSEQLPEFEPEGEGGSLPPPTDENTIEILINVGRPLTASELTAIENLKVAIEAIEKAIKQLSDNAILRLPNGAVVTGAELKEIWAKTDFVINDNDVAYRNDSYRGEANMVGDDPTVSFNIGRGLDDYDNFVGGMNYLVAHELGHLTQWGTSFVYDQTTANDISRALLNGAGLPYLANPGGGYTPNAPLQFSAS